MINIARNQAIDRARSKEISNKQKTKSLENIVHGSEASVEQSIEGIGVREVLNGLTDDQKFVVENLYLNGYTQSELADEFNIPLGTVKTRLRLAMQQLRKTLGVS